MSLEELSTDEYTDLESLITQGVQLNTPDYICNTTSQQGKNSNWRLCLLL